ncbi:hypothetical protein JCM3775_001176 [Rhodotorula graminis]|uniref:Uncharacterized protein n=1 Tax=Rhodotorula graminis (strain WP1) TaxID=578459 RepID=A0A194SFE8_RHOGW|nr:uncharacterized protein RHOBADRAFT_50786 [Rhodotorula graminis WP1]KPV78306.1 hypothetical protein RHOBADRAFT_50786 [Rhodotorula graminis WP1]
MVAPYYEPDSPVLHYEDDDEPELDGVRHLSVSSDGTIDSLVSLDENPTPPESPSFGPVVHVSPPEGHLSGLFDHGDLDDDVQRVDFGDDQGRVSQWKKSSSMDTAAPFLRMPFTYDAGPPTPGGIKVDVGLESPSIVSPTTPVPGAVLPSSLAARRAASGKLPGGTLAGLQQMRFEASGDAGMGLGVEPGTPGFQSMSLEGISPASSGVTMLAPCAAVDERSGRSSRSSTPHPSEMGAVAERAVRRIPSSLVLKLPRGFGSSSSPFSSPSTSAPPSPHISRSSAFVLGNSGPRTPLTPSHMPPAPSLGGGRASFEWHAYSFPDSPGCPSAPSSERACYFSDAIPSSPSSDRTAYLPTPGCEKARTPSARNRTPMPASPLGLGHFTPQGSTTSSTGTNPFFP